VLAHSFLPDAVVEFNEAFDWYETRSPGLGDTFAEQIRQTIDVICRLPLLSKIVFENVRRRSVRRFPYMIFYQVINEDIRIVSVFHTSRDPKVWQSRVKPGST
jgi:plasmid stabilization system protein ParE